MTTRDGLSLRAEVARKALHALTALLPISLAYGWIEQPALRSILALATLVALLIELLRATSPAFSAAFTRAVGALVRSHEQRALTGATWLAIAMTTVLWLAPLYAAITALWAAAVGDAAAAVVGRGVQRWQRRPESGKSFAGSLAALVATSCGALWLTPATIPVALLLGVVAAAVERPAVRVDDNLRITLAVALAAKVLGLR